MKSKYINVFVRSIIRNAIFFGVFRIKNIMFDDVLVPWERRILIDGEKTETFKVDKSLKQTESKAWPDRVSSDQTS